MNISLDWDGTVTAESTGFANFVNDMRVLGHKVYIVTMRYPSECVRDPMMRRWAHGVDGIIPTSRRSKQDVVNELGLKIHVWIDDHPEAVNKSAVDLWGSASPEGTIFIVDQVTGEHLATALEEPSEKVLAEIKAIENKIMVAPNKEVTDSVLLTSV